MKSTKDRQAMRCFSKVTLDKVVTNMQIIEVLQRYERKIQELTKSYNENFLLISRKPGIDQIMVDDFDDVFGYIMQDILDESLIAVLLNCLNDYLKRNRSNKAEELLSEKNLALRHRLLTWRIRKSDSNKKKMSCHEHSRDHASESIKSEVSLGTPNETQVSPEKRADDWLQNGTESELASVETSNGSVESNIQ